MNLLDQEIAAGIGAMRANADADPQTQMGAIIGAVDDARDGWQANQARTRTWPPADCRSWVDCEAHGKCVCVEGVCAHAGTVKP
jgi:hypothetical protein